MSHTGTGSEAAIHIGILPAHSPGSPTYDLERAASRAAQDVAPSLEKATGASWIFHVEAPTRLSSDDPRRPSDFLEEASLRMVEARYDAVLVVTDVAVVSRKERVVPGLASTVGRVAVLSTRMHRAAPRGESRYPLESEVVRWNLATLLLHLLGHMLALGHAAPGRDAVMSPFSFERSRRGLPSFTEESARRLPRLASRFPQREDRDQGTISELGFHLSSAVRHPRQAFLPVIRSRAPLLPLHLPRIATAALLPTFILVFTAEIWDAGFHMSGAEVGVFATLSVFASAVYLLMAQNLLLPHEEKRFQTEHLAVANVGICLTMLVATLGLFAMLTAVMLCVQIFIFPPDLVREWPSLELELATITLVDQVRIAGLISTIGVLTGALGGGLESRDLLRHLALFGSEP